MSSPLSSYAALHRQSEADARRLAETLPESALSWKPSPGAWSAVECLAHLNAVAAQCLPPLETAVRDGAKRGQGPFAYGRMAGTLRRALSPGSPPQRTNSSLDPARGRSAPPPRLAETLDLFSASVDRYLAVCDAADGLDLARIKVRNPFTSPLRLELGALLDITALHAQRHLAQAELTARAAHP